MGCTKKKCSKERPCCNNCRSSEIFKKVTLDSDEKTKGGTIGCNGNNCDWKKKCAYSHSKRDKVTVYGEVEKDYGYTSIKVHMHCKAKKKKKVFVICFALLALFIFNKSLQNIFIHLHK